jgi:hypothetical protein
MSSAASGYPFFFKTAATQLERSSIDEEFFEASRGVGYLRDWQALTSAHVAETRSLIESALSNRIVFTPIAGGDGALMYQPKVPIAFDRLLMSVVPSLTGGFNRVGGTSPTGAALLGLTSAMQKFSGCCRSP